MLIADDDPSIVRLLAAHCARMGFDVDTASNGIQALLKASRFKPDVLVIDVNMPEVDGLSVCAHLLDPDRAPVNVIVITGSRDPDTLERCEGFGAHYARKGPNFWNDFEAALEEIHPRMAGGIRRSAAQAPAPEVKRFRSCRWRCARKREVLSESRMREICHDSGRAFCWSTTIMISTGSSPGDAQ